MTWTSVTRHALTSVRSGQVGANCVNVTVVICTFCTFINVCKSTTVDLSTAVLLTGVWTRSIQTSNRDEFLVNCEHTHMFVHNIKVTVVAKYCINIVFKPCSHFRFLHHIYERHLWCFKAMCKQYNRNAFNPFLILKKNGAKNYGDWDIDGKNGSRFHYTL